MTKRLAIALLLVASAAVAQKPPGLELGFSPERMYSFGSLDSINAFNGNNLITIPLTLRYPVNQLSYSLSLVYNSKSWDLRYYADEFGIDGYRREARPNLRSNAGSGWRVSMGRLLPPTQYTASGQYKEDVHGWLYEGPSGDEHELVSGLFGTTNDGTGNGTGPRFSTDGSYLRMLVVNSSTRTVEFPGGEIHTFSLQRGVWRLTKMADPHQNSVTIAYAYVTPFDSRVQQWTISDSLGRQHIVRFQYLPDMADTVDRGMNVQYIDMQGVGGALLRYSFAYDEGRSAASCGVTTGIWFPLLTSITLPDQTTYKFGNDHCTNESLTTLTLPTNGVISYDYQAYLHPPAQKCASGEVLTGVGVKTRTVDGATWHYLQTYGPPEQTDPPTTHYQYSCGTDDTGAHIEPELPIRWARTSILSPPDATGSRTRTDNYFSVHSGAGGADRLAIPVRREYGAPVVNGWPGVTAAGLAFPPKDDGVLDESAADTPDQSTMRGLSKQTWTGCDANGNCNNLLRSVYRRDAVLQAHPMAFDGELESLRMVFHDDTGCGDGVPCFVQEDFSDFDGIGNWRSRSVSSNFPGAVAESAATAHRTRTDAELTNPAVPWLTTDFSQTTRTRGAATATTKHCFSTTGLLLRSRTLLGATENAHDIVTTYDYSAAGNLSDEKSYGGDRQEVAVTALCNLSLDTPEYWTSYTYANGTAATVTPRTAAGVALAFKAIDYSTDFWTGIVTTRRGTDGLATTYGYKAWGALQSITPPGETSTTYDYTPATDATLAKVTVTRNPNPSPFVTTDDFVETYEYDRVGRLQRHERTLPGAGCSEQVVTFDQLGRRDTVSAWKSCGASGNATVYRYDAFSRPTNITTPDGKSSGFSFFGSRVAYRTRDVSGTSVMAREEYDQSGRLVAVTDNHDTNPMDLVDDGITARYSYDVGGRLATVTMQKNPTPAPDPLPAGYVAPPEPPTQTRSFVYDNRGFLRTETHPELGVNGNGSTSYVETAANDVVTDGYDSRGLSHYRRTGSVVTRTAYDEAGRLTTMTDGATNRLLKQFVYDSFGACAAPLCAGKLAAAARYHYDEDLGDPATHALAVTESYQYDAATGKVARYDRTIGSTPGRFTGQSFRYSQTYDALGNLATMAYPCPTGSNGECDPAYRQRTVTNGYQHGLLHTVTPWASSITYQAGGAIDTVTHGSGSSAILEKWAADPHGMTRPRQITAETSGNVTRWSSGIYNYDGSGNIVELGNMRYTYDRFERLETATESPAAGGFNTTGYLYDDFGNFRANTAYGCGPTVNGKPACYTSGVYAAEIKGTTNQYSAFTYDDRGNVVIDRWQPVNGTILPQRTFTYDAAGTLARTQSGTSDFRFLYTPDDERIAAVRRVVGHDLVTRNQTTYTLRNLGAQTVSIFATDPFSGALSWKEDEIFRGSDLLARESTSGTAHYTVDHLGSPRAVTDAFGGLIGHQQFGAFGGGGSSTGGALQFTGHERDAATLAGGSVDLPDYMHARYYDVAWSRFLSIDPGDSAVLGVPQSWNRYAYALNNPLKYTDPTGRVFRCRTIEEPDGNKRPVCAEEIDVVATDPKVTPWRLGVEWLTGNGPRHRKFTDGDDMTEELKEHQHIQKVAREACSGAIGSSGREPHNLGGFAGVPKYLRDYSTLLTFGLAGNLTATYLGSYRLRYTVANGAVNMTVTNSSSIASGLRPPVIGYTDVWDRFVGQPLNSLTASGPMSKTTQEFNFTIPCR